MTPRRPKMFWGYRALTYSLRRYYVDLFQMSHVEVLSGRVLDLGGRKFVRKGAFHINDYLTNVDFANINSGTDPDVVCDAYSLPMKDRTYDGVICAELLEHVYNPGKVIAEVFRVLKTGGYMLMTVPFMHKIHGDPQDFGRYTDAYWKRCLEQAGFNIVEMERQGFFWSVFADMSMSLWAEGFVHRPRFHYFVTHLCGPVFGIFKRWAYWRDNRIVHKNRIYKHFTTGFGVLAQKIETRAPYGT